MATEKPTVFQVHLHDAMGNCVDVAFPVYRVDQDEAGAIRDWSLTTCWGMDAHDEVWPLHNELWPMGDQPGWDFPEDDPET